MSVTTDLAELPPAEQRAELAQGRGDGVGRLARRTQRGQGGRRTLVLVLIAVAVAIGVAAGPLVATKARSDLEVGVIDRLGGADLLLLSFERFEDPEPPPLTAEQRTWLEAHPPPADASRPPREEGAVPIPLEEALALLPPDARVLEYSSANFGYGGGGDELGITDLDVTDPLAGETFDTGGRTQPLIGQQALASPALLARFDAQVGDTIEVQGVGTVELVGTATRAAARSQPVLVVAPGREISSGQVERRARVDVPDGRDATGVADEIRQAMEHQRQQREAQLATSGPTDQFVSAPEAVSREQAAFTMEPPGLLGVLVGLLVTAFAATVAAMVAACAFAVGVRRRLRQIGMLGAIGATPGQVRRLLRREGLFIGVGGALLGGALGLGLAVAGQPVLERFMDRDVILTLPALAVVPPVLLGALASMAAAFWPARTAARVPVVAALAGRVPAGRIPPWLPPASVLLAVAGLVLFANVLQGPDGGALVVLQVFLAAMLCTVGAAGLGLPLLALGGRIADRLPLLARLAVRDAARQRTRSGAAIAALVPVLAMPVVVVIMATADYPDDSELVGLQVVYREPVPAPYARVVGPGAQEDRGVPPTSDAVEDVAQSLPVTGRRADVVALGDPDQVGRPYAAWTPPGVSPEDVERFGVESLPSSSLDLATPELLGLLGLPADAVEEGEVLFLSRGLYVEGPRPGQRVELVTYDHYAVNADGGRVNSDPDVTPVSLEVVTSDVPAIPGVTALVGSGTATELGLAEVGRTVALALERPPTNQEARALSDGVDHRSGWVDVRTGPPFWLTSLGKALLIGAGALAVALLVTIVAGMTAALAATESDADLRKVVAFGAPPRVRRSFHGVQAWWHASIAGALGTGLGIVIALVVLDTSNLLIDARIWPAAAAWLVVMPVVVGLVIALFMRSSPVEAPRRRMA